ncbi:hypothetical protein A1D25_02655 [Ursidibacter arcticus]|uniref:helix-turn-helix domain-containing protein n=1 Tax=Ursidibacter arcticus TaxID=1524965 RepID=UPI0012F854BB|nr:helix-turn-helix transcriptional regulator [Ursidibacter arcticus]KAE9537104.1 hypothetical protein A1D25_02655 [Ursidibacter arcticus]
MNERKLFAENLKKILVEKGITPKASVLEREFNLHHYGKPIGLHAVARWLRGEALPSLARLRTLADWLEVELTELVSNETAYKINKVEKQKEPSKHIWETAASYQDQVLFETFLKLPQEQRKIVREVIIAMHKAYRENK